MACTESFWKRVKEWLKRIFSGEPEGGPHDSDDDKGKEDEQTEEQSNDENPAE